MTSPGPDFSHITNESAALELVRAGQLEPMLLLPAIFGGRDDVAANVVYVPVGLADVKAGIDENIIAPLARDGRITRYTATPRYAGNSTIPIAVDVSASEPGAFNSTIAIWGPALRDA